MESRTRKSRPNKAASAKKGSNAASSSTKAKAPSLSHIARPTSALNHSALLKIDPMWPCKACRESRAKCEGGFPCSRCFEMCLCCLPNEEQLEESTLHYVLTSHSPKPFAEMYTQAFERLYLANKIRRDSAIRVLKMWSFLSCLAEADVTLGVAEHVRRRFDISPLELEEPTGLIQSPPPHVRTQRLRLYLTDEAKQARTQQLKETAVFKLHDDSSAGSTVLMLTLQTNFMWAVCNDAFAARLDGATELWDKAQQLKVMWAYLMAPIYAHQDRQLYLDTMAEMTFANEPRKLVLLLKMYTREGKTDLHLTTVRRVVMGEGKTVLIFTTEVAPPSRHVTTRPGFVKVTSRVRSNWAVIQEGREEDCRKKANITKDRKGKARQGKPASSISSSSTIGGVSADNFYVPGIVGFPFAVEGVNFPFLSLVSAPTRSQTPTPMEMMGGGLAAARGAASIPSSSSFGVRMEAMPTAEMEALFVRSEEGMGGRGAEGRGYGRGHRRGGRATRMGSDVTRVQLAHVPHGLPQTHLLVQEAKEGSFYGSEDGSAEQDEGEEELDGYLGEEELEMDADEEDEDEDELEEEEEESWEDVEEDDDEEDDEGFNERGDQKEDGQDVEERHQNRQEQQEQQQRYQHQHQHYHQQHQCRQQQQRQQQQQQQQKYSQILSPVADFLADSRSMSQIISNFPPPPPPLDPLNKASSTHNWPDASSLLPFPLVIVPPSSEKTSLHACLAERRQGGREGRGGGRDVSTTISAFLSTPNDAKEKVTAQVDAHDDFVQRLPSLGSPFPGSAPYFDETMLLDVFEEAGRRGIC